jgi:putative ABC transport system ATP-binding protein
VRIVAQDLSIAVPGRILFQALSFDWLGPSLVAVIGPSGAGKSTLLSAIIGWTKPIGGSLRVQPANSQIWLAPQNAPLLDTRTVSENIELALLPTLKHTSEAELDGLGIAKDLPAHLETFGLQSIANTRAKHLSGGERQRVALARAAIRHPDVLLADEITAGLDPGSVALVTDALDKLARTGTLVITATHDQRVWSAADTVLDLAELT